MIKALRFLPLLLIVGGCGSGEQIEAKDSIEPLLSEAQKNASQHNTVRSKGSGAVKADPNVPRS